MLKCFRWRTLWRHKDVEVTIFRHREPVQRPKPCFYMWCFTLIDNLTQLGKTVLTRDCLHWVCLWACLGQYGWHHSLRKDFRTVWEWRNSAEHKQVSKHAFLTLWSWPWTWCDWPFEVSALTSLAWQAGTVSWNKHLCPLRCLFCQTVSHNNGNEIKT